MPAPGGADWALAAALHDILQSANPMFVAPLRRRAAARILELAAAVIERVPPPATAGQALSRHTWLARVPEVTRTDTAVRWWTGHREFLGVEPPPRLQAWPQLRRVEVVRTPHPLLELAPLAVDRAYLTATVAALLARTPLTDLATCTRAAPAFTWHASALDFVASPSGRTLTLRALARLAPAPADAALGRATRALLAAGSAQVAAPALSLLGDRALLEAERQQDADGRSDIAPADTDATAHLHATFARALGAVIARRALRTGDGAWSDAARLRLLQTLAVAAQSAAAREANTLLEQGKASLAEQARQAKPASAEDAEEAGAK